MPYIVLLECRIEITNLYVNSIREWFDYDNYIV